MVLIKCQVIDRSTNIIIFKVIFSLLPLLLCYALEAQFLCEVWSLKLSPTHAFAAAEGFLQPSRVSFSETFVTY